MISPIRFLGLSTVLLAAACADQTAPPPIQHSTPVSFDMPTGRLALAPISVDLPPRRGLGTYYRNVDCWVRIRSIMPNEFPDSAALTNGVAQVLTSAKLSVVLASGPTVSAAGAADYLLVASVPTAHADACVDNIFNTGPADVDAQVALSWKLFSVKDNRVVYETTTTGTARASDPAQTIDAGVYAAAGDATRQFLGASAAQQYLTYGRVVVPPTSSVAENAAPVPAGGSAPIPQPPQSLNLAPLAAPALPPILVPVAPARGPGSAIDVAALRAATVKVGDSGAGFMIGGGYVLTVSSTIGASFSVPVTLPSGQTEDASLVRRDDAVGIALLKLDQASLPGLPIQPRHNAVGDHVYGIGPSGLVEGAFSSTRASGGRDAVLLGGAVAGSPVLDAAGNVIGVLLSDGGFLSIGTGFKMLQLGVQPSED